MTSRNLRFFQAICALIMVCLINFSSHAQYSGGTGEPNNPYKIANVADWQYLMNSTSAWNKSFVITADIDFNGVALLPIGLNGLPYSGTFDGQGHTIKNAVIQGPNIDNVGLFSTVGSNALICNLNITSVTITGRDYVGGLAGYNWGTIKRCYIEGSISGRHYVGGLLGLNKVSSYNNKLLNEVFQCSGSCSVSGDKYVGGLIGWNGHDVGFVPYPPAPDYKILAQCYSTGAIDGNECVGGLVGGNSTNVIISECYSTSLVNGNIRAGGLTGYNEGIISRCYSTGTVTGGIDTGGLMGYSTRTDVLNGVWDTETSGLKSSFGGVGLSTSQMKNPNVLGLNGFASDPNWVVDAGNDYPRLAWEETEGEMIPEPDIDWMIGKGTSEAPYQIETIRQLIMLSISGILLDKYFVLNKDINLDPNLPGGQIFSQAVIPVFMGNFDGNNHVISHLVIHGGLLSGLFGYLSARAEGSYAEVSNLGVTDVNISGAGDYAGGLAGFNNYGTIIRCYTSGTITACSNAGGLVGKNQGSSAEYNKGTIFRSYSSCDVNGVNNIGGLVGNNAAQGTMTQSFSDGTIYGNDFVGGLAGYNFSGTVTQCFSTSIVDGNQSVGGLVGINDTSSIVNNCFSTGTISGIDKTGGLVGKSYNSKISMSYSAADVNGIDSTGGLVGWDSNSVISACFWDTETSRISDNGVGNIEPDPNGVSGRNKAQMQTSGTYLSVGWDFINETTNGTQDIWRIQEGQSYPSFVWEIFPDKAANPSPIYDERLVNGNVTLRWTPGIKGALYNVYFGSDVNKVTAADTENPLGVMHGRNIARTNFFNGPLANNTTYYWRVDEVVDDTIITGDIWRFLSKK